MERQREQGFAALWIIAALGLSTLVGVAVYVVMKERREASEAQEAKEAKEEAEARQRAAEMPISIDAGVDGPEAFEVAASPDPTPVAPPPPVDRAAAEAVDPELGDGPPSTNAPLFGTPGVEGALDKDAIATAARGAAPRLQGCFEKRLAAGGQVVGGTMRVTLIVNRRGGVTDASAVGVDDELATCVAATLRDIRFPRTTDGEPARIVYPIAFHNADGADEGDARPSRQPAEDGLCDEVSCVLNNFEGACCAKFKQPEKLPDQPSPKDLQAAVTLLRTKVARCASDEAFSGKLVVKFQIQPDGSTSKYVIAKVPPRVGGCIVRAFNDYPWPHSKKGTAASFPFQIQLDE
jgi:hypothetical protein